MKKEATPTIPSPLFQRAFTVKETHHCTSRHSFCDVSLIETKVGEREEKAEMRHCSGIYIPEKKMRSGRRPCPFCILRRPLISNLPLPPPPAAKKAVYRGKESPPRLFQLRLQIPLFRLARPPPFSFAPFRLPRGTVFRVYTAL